MACPDEKEAVRMQEAEGGRGTYKKAVGGREENLWNFRQEILSSVWARLKRDILSWTSRVSLVAQIVKSLPAVQETWV